MKRLTIREIELVKLLSEGKSNKEIAICMCISVHTVKSMLEKIYTKLSLHNRVLVAMYYAKVFLLKKSNN